MVAGTGQRRGATAPLSAPCPRGAPAVVVHTPAQARAALETAGSGRGVLLLSAPAAAGSIGAAWFLALVAQAVPPSLGAAGERPVPPHWAALDCGNAPGFALAALRAGVRVLVLDPSVPAFPAVAAAAGEVGGEVWPERPPALDLGRLDLRRLDGRGRGRLAEWLTGGAVTASAGLG
ncbi:MAG: hypothetical protein ICV73_04385 [Acetobacteraceae bacterium]|nr:hypothetical protein [Acetobacteraceae bacterium]